MPQGRTALYRLFDEAHRLLYVGISHEPEKRVKAHHGRRWWKDVVFFRTEWRDTRFDAAEAERDAIKTESPLYNIAETPFHTRLAGHKTNPLTLAERLRWESADTSGVKAEPKGGSDE
jgi:predicted GIY-YIG superfamily endonuclease